MIAKNSVFYLIFLTDTDKLAIYCRAAASNISSKPGLGYTDKRIIKTAQSIAEPQASDAIILDLPDENLPSEFTGPRSQVPKDVNVTSNQLYLDSIKTGTQWGKKTSFMGLSSLSDSASCISTDGERESSEVQNIHKQIVHIGELPSFDLGI
ncbi:uncharacterized protein LOC122666081 [Telopea speciosissima]|uniref:uncharacterized protein LOC122666081 n=1 Tax=Telopea speciosissima TaxID=54955 RepID=UPI001CC43CCD|nr:uncharacterized protein LOC122666081 [Telopea speciosissima]